MITRTLAPVILVSLALEVAIPDHKIAAAAETDGQASSPATAGRDDDAHLTYAIPPGAIKKGPWLDRGGDTRSFNHYDPKEMVRTRVPDPGTPHWTRPKLVGVERFSVKTEKLVQRELYTLRDGTSSYCLHGVQRQCYEDGTPKSEEPYRKGVMHGVFKYWDESGNLVGCYRMVNGTGVRRLYFSNGRLSEEYHYRDGKFHGPHYQFFENGQIWSLSEASEGHWLAGVQFYRSGALAAAWDPSPGALTLCGGMVEFYEDGTVKDEDYRVYHKRVSREEYEEHAARDPKLPKLEKDAEAYRSRVDDRVRAIVKKYKEMPPVKIPLEGPEEDAE